MFGESESESPRAPSPWDSLATPPLVPKLIPEVEEGNVEYKLQLLSPTRARARFDRLVTQLKWRLLEGGGQAYYELGVADSGMLVGLSRQQLDESLETLEMMAGEIGASVIVVKEVQVPPEISGLAESQLETWKGRKCQRRKDVLRMSRNCVQESTLESETEFLTIDITDADESSTCSPITPPPSLTKESTGLLSSSPPLPFDPTRAMAALDLAEDVAHYADNEDPDTDVAVSLEICSVYKPRPMKKRATHVTYSSSSHYPHARKKLKNGHPPSNSTGDSNVQPHPLTESSKDERDRRKEAQIETLPNHQVPESPTNPIPHYMIPPSPTLVPHSEPPSIIIEPPTDDREPRLIVEALVVRKFSLDEAFLDFAAFSL